MDSINFFIFVFVFLIIAVAFVVNIQRKEQKKAEQFNQAAKYKHRANQAANVLSNFSRIPIGEETRRILLQVIQKNLMNALNIQPNDKYVKDRLPEVNKQLQTTANSIDSNPLLIPSDPKQLEAFLNSLVKLRSYISAINKTNHIELPLIKQSIAKISSLIIEIKLSAYIQQIQKGIATNNFEFANKRMVTTKQLFAGLKSENTRILTLKDKLIALEKELKNKFQATKKVEKPKETIKPSGEENNLFGPKKKW